MIDYSTIVVLEIFHGFIIEKNIFVLLFIKVQIYK